MADRLVGILGHKALEFGLGMLVLEVGDPGPGGSRLRSYDPAGSAALSESPTGISERIF